MQPLARRAVRADLADACPELADRAAEIDHHGRTLRDGPVVDLRMGGHDHREVGLVERGLERLVLQAELRDPVDVEVVVVDLGAREQQALDDLVYGDGTQRRCFCHVSDVVRALEGLMEHEAAYGRVFNVGSTEETSIIELAHRVIESAGSGSEVTLIPFDEVFEEGFEDMYRRIPDPSRIKALMGWEPTQSLDEIVADVVKSRRTAAVV